MELFLLPRFKQMRIVQMIPDNVYIFCIDSFIHASLNKSWDKSRINCTHEIEDVHLASEVEEHESNRWCSCSGKPDGGRCILSAEEEYLIQISGTRPVHIICGGKNYNLNKIINIYSTQEVKKSGMKIESFVWIYLPSRIFLGNFTVPHTGFRRSALYSANGVHLRFYVLYEVSAVHGQFRVYNILQYR